MSGQRPIGPAAAPARRLSDAQRLDWLRLIRSESVGPRTFRGLVNRHGSAAAALAALPALGRERLGRPIAVASQEDAERELAAARRIGARFVALGEPDYPRLLAEIADAPPLLAVLGARDVSGAPPVALVGSRNGSVNGMLMAERLSRDLGAEGFVTVSGLARGVDAAVHRASLATGTVAVLAGGLDRPYPPENLALFEAVAAEGLVVSEMPFGWEPRGRDFPRRNRIISGIAYATVVVEATLRSGSLITARFAHEQGREVFAVPGSPLDPRAEGANDLLARGEAALLRSAAEIVAAVAPMAGGSAARRPSLFADDGPAPQTDALWDEWPDIAAPAPAHALGEEAFHEPSAPNHPGDLRARVLDCLGPLPVHPDDVARLTGLSPRALAALVIDLEIEGALLRDDAGRLLPVLTPQSPS